MAKGMWEIVSGEEVASLRKQRPSALRFLKSGAFKVMAVGPLIACNPEHPTGYCDTGDCPKEDYSGDSGGDDTAASGDDTGAGEDTAAPADDTGAGEDTAAPADDTGAGEDTAAPVEDTGSGGETMRATEPFPSDLSILIDYEVCHQIDGE